MAADQKQGRLDAEEASELLETIVLQQAAETAARGLSYASRLARVKTASWQADVIRKSKDAMQVENASALRIAMGNPAVTVIFLPQEAAVTAEIIERICAESALEKFLIWETDT